MELRCRSSFPKADRAASTASGTPAARSRCSTSSSSPVSTQWTTSAMSRSAEAAANRSGARSRDAVAYQKSPSVMEPTWARPTSVRVAAARRAPGQVRDAGTGDQATAGRPVDPEGSKQRT